MRKYYLLNGKKQSGPFSLDELKNMEITDKFMVWSEEMSEWKKSTEVDELAELIIKAPINPPLTPTQKNFEIKKKAFYLALRKALLWLVIITLTIFIIMGGLSTDTFLERIYTISYNNRVFADASEIRLKYGAASGGIFSLKSSAMMRANPSIARKGARRSCEIE